MKMQFAVAASGKEVAAALNRACYQKSLGVDMISHVSLSGVRKRSISKLQVDMISLSHVSLSVTQGSQCYEGTYRVLNPKSAKLAEIVYEGTPEAFLAQKQQIAQLLGRLVAPAVIVGDAVLDRHGVHQVSHADAWILAEAYLLAQNLSSTCPYAFEKALLASLQVSQVNAWIAKNTNLCNMTCYAHTAPRGRTHGTVVVVRAAIGLRPWLYQDFVVNEHTDEYAIVWLGRLGKIIAEPRLVRRGQ
jgi:hypothetical protein